MAISKTAGVFVKEGDTLDITIAADGTAINCGDIKVVDGCNCLALWDIAAGTSGTMKILHKGEVVKITTDEAIGATAAGTAIYVVAATGLVTKTDTNNTLLGYAAAAIGATDLSFDIVCA